MADCERNEQERFCYRNVEVYKGDENSLGCGSYGTVFKASCDQLPCAAKQLHPVLFQHNDPMASRILERFEQECAFMSQIRHPHIVQYLGVCRDQETTLPILLMELLDESLTKFLERSEELLPYHIQVNLCHDITLALAYLHANKIIHRDLSSNNVLLAGNRAKVTDFGMSKLVDISRQVSSNKHTKLPGTDGYMPPEAILEPLPTYTGKLDCFSFGVLTIQILTRKFPDPSRRTVLRSDHMSPTGSVEVPVLDTERRKNHIDLLDPAHPLLGLVIVPCLNFHQEERPSADDLCLQIATLKDTTQYEESMQELQHISNVRQISCLQDDLHVKNQLLQEAESQLVSKERQIEQLLLQLEEKEHELLRLRQVVSQNEGAIQSRDTQIQGLQCDLEQLRRHTVPPQHPPVRTASSNGHSQCEFQWETCKSAPSQMSYGATAANGNQVFFRPAGSNYIFTYDAANREWGNPLCSEYQGFGLAVVDGVLTTVGGCDSHKRDTNQLLSYTKQGSRKWEERLLPMKKKRVYPAVVSNERVLVAAGGQGMMGSIENTVEVFNIKTHTWFEATELPQPMPGIMATLSSNTVYIGSRQSKSVFTYSVSDLCSTARNPYFTQSPIWNRIHDLPFSDSMLATIDGQLVAIGGKNPTSGAPAATDSVSVYNPVTNTWVATGSMNVARVNCLVATIPGNKLIIAGGRSAPFLASNDLDIVECATLI